MSVRLSPPLSCMRIDMSLSLIGVALIHWAASQLEIAKSTPAVLSSPPLQKIEWLLSTMYPVPSRRTSLRAKMSMLAFSNSRQMRAVARPGLIEESLSLVVQTFQAPRLRRCLFQALKLEGRWCRLSASPDAVAVYGLRPLVPTTVSSGASVPPYAVAISSVLVCTSIRTVGLHLWCRHCLAHGQRPLARNSVDRQHSKAEMVAEKLVVYCQNWSRIDCQDCRFRSSSRVDYQDRLAWWPMAHKELIRRLAGVVFSPARVTCHPPHQKTAGEGSHAVGCTGLHGTSSRHDVWPDLKCIYIYILIMVFAFAQRGISKSWTNQ